MEQTPPPKRKGRSGAEWEELALKVLLLHPELAVAIRDTSWEDYKHHRHYMAQLVREYDADQKIMLLDCKYGTYALNRIAKALRNLQRDALKSLDPEARQREWQRHINRNK